MDRRLGLTHVALGIAPLACSIQTLAFAAAAVIPSVGLSWCLIGLRGEREKACECGDGG